MTEKEATAMARITFSAALLAVAGTFGCASEPGTPPREDAGTTPNDVAMVDNDRPTPSPDVARKDDAGTPTPDAQVQDAGVPQDVERPEDRGTPPPPDATMGFDPMLAEVLRSRLRIQGNPLSPERASVTMQADHTATVRVSAEFAGAIGCGYTNGVCSGDRCDFPNAMTHDRCTWQNLSVPMRQFTARGGDGTESTIEVLR